MIFDKLLFSSIKEDIIIKSGLRIQTFSDCVSLSRLLESDKLSLSAYTIGRMFGIIKSDSKPYISSVSILLDYLGFSSIENYINYRFNNSNYNLNANVPDGNDNIEKYINSSSTNVYGVVKNTVKPLNLSKNDLTELHAGKKARFIIIVLE